LLLAWHPYLLPAVDPACVTGILEVSVIAKMCSRKCEFEPDPVPAVRSVRQDLAMERNYKMRRHMVVGAKDKQNASQTSSIVYAWASAFRLESRPWQKRSN